MISHNGVDSTNCGKEQSMHCRTIGYTLSRRAGNNDIIKINNNKMSKPFIFNRSFPLLKDITIVGVKGWPTVLAQNPDTYLFEKTELSNLNVITMRMKNLVFKGSGVVHLRKSSSGSNILFQNCHFENVVIERDIFRIENQIGVLEFRQCSFLNNTANSRLITIFYSYSVFKNCYFIKNLSTANGSIALIGGLSSLKDTNFVRNIVIGKFVTGGAIYISSYSVVEIVNCSFEMNKASSIGGAISYCRGDLTVNSSSHENNTVSLRESIKNQGDPYGKITYEKRRELVIKASSFLNNSALEGGAIYVSPYEVKTDIYNCIFKGNTAQTVGGAIKINGKELRLDESSFNDNSASNDAVGKGGAICSTCYINANATTPISKCGDDVNVSFPEQLIIIMSSKFSGNNAHRGGAVAFLSKTANGNISNCTFKANRAHHGGVVWHTGNKLFINKSVFHENRAYGGGAFFLSNWANLIIKTSFIENNRVSDRGGVMHANSITTRAAISNCTIKGNTAGVHGGAICHYGKELILSNVYFQSNTLSCTNGQGGALYLYNSNSYKFLFVVNITNCTFDKNMAAFRGAAIVAIEIKLLIRKSVFLSSSYSHQYGYSGGEFLYSMSKVTLEHVSFHDLDNHNLQSSLITHQGEGKIFKYFNLKSGVRISCFNGKYVEMFNQSLSSETKGFLQFERFFAISCSFCQRNYYSLSAGKLFFQNQTIIKTQIKCYPCPLGGVCENGTIRTSANSWGYDIPGGKLRFITCPFGYCCNQGHCKNYSSCRKGRNGRLCGQCENGLTENLMTSDCLLPKTCRHPWFTMVAIVAGIAYVFVFMYVNEVMAIIKMILIPMTGRDWSKLTEFPTQLCQFITSFFKKIFTRRVEMQYLTNAVSIDQTDSEESVEEMGRVVDIFTYNPVVDDNKTVDMFPGLLKILIFFYQTNILFKIQTGTKSHNFIHLLQEVISATFNLRVDGTFAQDLSWCPFARLQPVSKILLKNSFVVYLFILVILIFVLLKLGKSLKVIGEEHYVSNKSRLLCCTLRFILISYAGVTNTCFSLLSCVHLDSIGRVLFIDGSIKCYNQWQMIVFFTVSFWVCPFPISIYTSSQLLHHYKLSTRGFLLCLLFPVPSIFYWLYMKICGSKKTGVELRKNAVANKITKDALEIMEGPFRNSRKHNTDNNYRLSWEAIYIGRRLLLILVKTFAIDTFTRLSIMLWCTVLFLVHHIYIKPFDRDVLNDIETVSLLMLIGICFLNLIPAYYYAYPLGSFLNVEKVIKNQQQVETILNLVFPSLVGLCVTVLVIMRIWEITLCLYRCFMRLFSYAKQKLT